jgi:hypothetical protein
MAGNDDRDRVLAVRRADGATCRWPTDRTREQAVAARLAVRNCGERAPHALLKAGALRRERNVERTPPADEILDELRRGRAEHRAREVRRFRRRLIRQVNADELVRFREQSQHADR